MNRTEVDLEVARHPAGGHLTDQAMREPRTSFGKPRGAGRVWLAILLVSLLGGAWLLATKTLGPWIVDLLGNSSLFFYLLAIPAYLVGLLSAFVLLVSAPAERTRLAALPVLLSALALAVFLFAPLSRPLSLLDFQRHFTTRAEVVRRVEADELRWTGSPIDTLVSLPRREFPPSVSNGVGQGDVLVFREDGALHVVFFPSLSFWPGHYSVFLYRSDGRSPSLTNPHLQGYTWSEPLAERWWRVVRDK